MPKYSHSQISLYKQCQLKYKYKYIDWYKTEFEETADTILWNIVHSTLEYLYNNVNNFNQPSLEQTQNFYKKLWQDKIYEYAKKWEEIIIKSKNQQLEDYLRRWEIYLNYYFEKYKPFDDSKVVWIEMMLSFKLDEKVSFVWYIDRLDKKWDTFIINDYKTNKNLPAEDKDTYIEQLTLYWLGIKEKYWKYFKNIEWSLHYLHFDLTDSWKINEENLNKIKDQYLKIVYEIENKKVENSLWNSDAFEPNETPLCKFCEYMSICPLFSHIFSEDEIIDFEWNKTLKKLIDELWEKNDKKKELEAEIRNTKDILTKYMNWKEYKKLYWEKYKISISSQNNYRIIDKEWLKTKLSDLKKLAVTLEIDKQKVVELIKNWEISADRLSSYIENYDIFVIRISKV